MALFDSLYAQTRAVLGLDSFDLKDSKLEDWGVLDDLLIDLDQWLPDYEKIVEQKGSAMESRLRSYAKYYCASICVRVGATFIVKVWTDGETKFERFEGDWEALSQYLKSQADRIKLNIQQKLGLITDTDDIGFKLTSVSSPDRDPVTTPRDS